MDADLNLFAASQLESLFCLHLPACYPSSGTQVNGLLQVRLMFGKVSPRRHLPQNLIALNLWALYFKAMWQASMGSN